MADCSKKEKVDYSRFLPREIKGWKAEADDQSYDPQTIFSYINGAGEVYRSYNFRELLVRKYRKEENSEIIVDFFIMASSQDAYGVFTHDLEGEDAGIGQGSTYKGGLLSFWKGHFFVSVYTERVTDEIKEAVLSLGQAIASSIEEEGEKPSLLTHLPPGLFDEKSVHYFHNHMILNYHFFVSTENILFLDQQTEAVLAAGFEGEEKFYLLLAKYPQAGRAPQACESFTRTYMPDASAEGIVETEDGKWTAAGVQNDVVFVIFNAPSSAFAGEMREKVKQRIMLLSGRGG